MQGRQSRAGRAGRAREEKHSKLQAGQAGSSQGRKQVGQDRQHWQNGVNACIDWRACAIDFVYYSTMLFLL